MLAKAPPEAGFGGIGDRGGVAKVGGSKIERKGWARDDRVS